jgi:membrane-associated phospholipid phosphatase
VLNGYQHALDYNETRVLGEAHSTLRTAEETLVAQFWNSVPPTLPFNRLTVQFAIARHFDLVDTARVLALLTTAMADSVIACWDAKYFYQTWRPVTEIPLADDDQNPSIVPQPGWTPLLVTPPFPEYPSLHSSQSAAAAAVIAAFFGANTPFSVTSEAMSSVTRSFPGTAAALEEIADARVFGGIHYRTACQHGQALGATVAAFVLEHILQPGGNGQHHEQDHDVTRGLQ